MPLILSLDNSIFYLQSGIYLLAVATQTTVPHQYCSGYVSHNDPLYHHK